MSNNFLKLYGGIVLCSPIVGVLLNPLYNPRYSFRRNCLNGMENGLFVGIMCPISFPIITYCYIRGAVESDDTEEWSGKYDLDEKKID